MLALATNAERACFCFDFRTAMVRAGNTRLTRSLTFARMFGESTDLFFVKGADSWAEITTWYEWRRLITLTNLVVVTRPGYEIGFDHGRSRTAARRVDFTGLQRFGRISLEEGAPKVFVTTLSGWMSRPRTSDAARGKPTETS
jgi:nicotinic acid mononucleotide adenylyltransferase